MVHDLSQDVDHQSIAKAGAFAGPRQAVAGLMPPQMGEARIREAWPAISAKSSVAKLGQKLVRTVILAPLGWLILAPLFLKKIAPFVCRRYTLTNRRLMIQRGLKPRPVQEIPLADIDEVRFDKASYDPYYFTGNLDVISKGQVVMHLPGVPEPEGFRHAILNAVKAWVPGKAKGPFLPASAPVKT
jgi:hypothetical protein